MTKIAVTVEFDFPRLDESAARALAKQLIEGRGLTVSGTRIVPDKDQGKQFIPKAGKPGSIVHRGGRAFQVWSDGPGVGQIWIVPVDRIPGDASAYLTRNGEDSVSPPLPRQSAA